MRSYLVLIFVAGLCSRAPGQTSSSIQFQRRDVPTPQNPYNLDAADVDGDGDVDLIAVSQASDSMYVLLNEGTGSFRLGWGWPWMVSTFK